MKSIEIGQFYGLASQPSKAKLPIGFSQSSSNFHDIDLSTPGKAVTRGGLLTLTTLAGNPTVRRIFDWYLPSTDEHTCVIHAGTKIYTMDDSGTTAEIDSGLNDGEVMDFLNYGNQLFYSDGESGDTRIYNATSSRKWGISGPGASVPTVASSGTGITGTYSYRVAYVNSISGHISTASNPSLSITVTNKQIDLSSIPQSSDPQVDKINIYRTTSGGAIYFYLTQINDGTTTYSDTTTDVNLLTSEAPYYNDPPPDFFGIEEWDGRIWGFEKNSTKVSFTNDEFRTQDGNPEESVHPDNYIDFNAKVFGIKKSPNFDELWVHTSKGIYAAKRTEIDSDPYRPVIRNSNWHSINHYSIQNLYTEQYFMHEAGKYMSMDSSGSIAYESYLIEPDVSGGNLVLFNTIQAANYRKGTKNQYISNFVRSGQTSPDRIFISNYLMRTPVMENGRNYPVWETHTISGTSLGVVINSYGEDTLYIGTSDGKIKKADTINTDDDDVAISWAFSLGWMRSSENIDTSNMPLRIVQYFNPLGSWNINLQTNFDFGYSGGQIYPVSFAPEGDMLDVNFFLDRSILGSENTLKRVTTRFGGVYSHVELIWYGSATNQIMDLHTVVLQVEQIQGFRDSNR